MQHGCFCKAGFGLISIALLAHHAWAQVVATGIARLKITDPSGASVDSARISVSRPGSASRATQTDHLGVAILSDLVPGLYRLSVLKSGFTRQQLDFEVRSGISTEKTVVLAVQTSGFSVDVVATTPLSGSELDRDKVPAPLQTANAADIAETGATNLGSFLNRRFTGIHINEIQGNPFQPDVNYRGYTASPLLGTPQGISIYMDGVRLNQPFGDVVSWDLIPRIAIAETTLIPGSNPLFGLNTLGGAIAVETKDGLNAPGTNLTLAGGSWGRKTAEIEHGGSNRKGLSWYAAANLFFEDGWRAGSPSDVRQFFGKLGWAQGSTSVHLAVSFANNALTGNGLQDQRLLARNYSSVYTKPDLTANRSPFLNLSARHSAGTSLTFSGNAYYRFIRTRTLNGDVNQDSLDQAVYQPTAADIRALTAAGYSGFPAAGANAQNTPFPFWRCVAQVLQRGEPAENCNGLLNRTAVNQQNYGVSGQVTWSAHRQQLTAGAAFDRRTSTFGQLSQLGYLTPDRAVTPVAAFGDGISAGSVNGSPYDTRVNLDGRANTASVFASDTYSFARAFSLTVSGRYNRNTVRNFDGFNPGGGPGSLDSSNVFRRFNPAAGLTYRAVSWATFYFSYSEGSRAPTSTELGCADPAVPCRLPNALAGDPPLRQVVTRTFEAGLRGGTEAGLGWNAGWFRAENRDDLLFAASTQTGYGYFKNFGKTRRQGLETNVHGRIHKVDLGGGYTFLDATYQSAETVDAVSNSTNLNDAIQIEPGNRIPLVPRNTLKAYALWNPASRLGFNLDLNATGRSFARGNENNLSVPDGLLYPGPGISPGYAVLNLGSHYNLRPRVQLFIEVDNLTDRRYYSGAQLNVTALTASGAFVARPFPSDGGSYQLQHATFYALGAPRTIWGGIRYHF